MKKNVKIIAPSMNESAAIQPNIQAKKRVAAYARVSTGSDEQATSFNNQVEEWTKRINNNPTYELVKVYTDEGISGTSAKGRLGFIQMVNDAKAGKIDLILVKSISRFARNTSLSIQTVRELKQIGVEVYFDNENISSLDPKSEMIFSILCSIAQEESRHISENVNWTIQKMMQEGRPMCNTTRFLGYDKNEAGDKLVINEEQAKTVRLIFDLYDAGNGCLKIVKELQKRGLKTATGADFVNTSAVLDILKNEKYVGDLLLQKTYTADYLGHVRKDNKGERSMYFIEDAHDAIITREQWKRVQERLKKSSANQRGNDKDTRKYNNKYPLSGMLMCIKCGNTYKRRLWNSKHPTARKFTYQCRKYGISDATGVSCHSEPICENIVQDICCDIINKLYVKNTKVFTKLASLLQSTLSVDKIAKEKEQRKLAKEQTRRKIDELVKKRIQASSLELKDVIDGQCAKLVSKLESLNSEINKLSQKEYDLANSQDRLKSMLDVLNKKEFTSEMLNKEVLETFFYKIIVCGSSKLVFVIDTTHTMSMDELVAKRAEIVNYKPIYSSSKKGKDGSKDVSIEYKIVTV